jgi:hypothetical protein
MHHATIALANAKRHSRFAAFVCPTAPTVQGQCTRNNCSSKSKTPFKIRGICRPSCAAGAGPMHRATIALANAKRHSKFAAFVCPTAPTVQDQCTTQRSLEQMRNAIQDSRHLSAQLHRRCRANAPRNNCFSKCKTQFKIRGICLPNCTDGAGPMHHATIALANAKRHSKFAAFVCPNCTDGARANAPRNDSFSRCETQFKICGICLPTQRSL